MPTKCNIEKIKKEIDKCETPEELMLAYSQVQGYISDKLKEKHQASEEAAKSIQRQLDIINGN